MKNNYKNTIFAAYLLSCLFITYVSAQSFIRQFTDDFNTNLQQAEPNQNLDVTQYLDKSEEIISHDYKVSASNIVKGLRNRRPSSYTLKMESFNTLLKSNIERYESRPFTVGEYNWTLIVYPNGNKKDSGSGFLSLYVSIDNSKLIAEHKDVYADLRFYIFNKNGRKYFTIQDTDVRKFDIYKNTWGFSQVLSVNTFKDPKNGYIYDGDHCEFGVDVIIPSLFQQSEFFTVNKNFQNPKFIWTIEKFSTLVKDSYLSDMFIIGGRKWNIKIYPNGVSTGKGKFLSMFLSLNANEKLKSYEKIYVEAKLRILNKSSFNNQQKSINYWYNDPGYWNAISFGYIDFISLNNLKDSSKGFIVNDELKMEVEMEALSSIKYFPA